MKTEKEFIQAVSDLIEKTVNDPKLEYRHKLFIVASLSILRNDVKDCFKDIRRIKKMNFNIK